MIEKRAAPEIGVLKQVWRQIGGGRVCPVGDLLPGDDDDQAGIAASYLVRAGVLERGEDLAWTGRVWVPDDARALLEDLAATAPELAADGHHILDAADRIGSEEYRLETWQRETGWHAARVESVLLELTRRGIVGFWHWEIAWQLEPSGATPDWRQIAQQLDERRRAVAKLIARARDFKKQDRRCRRAWLLSYLGVDHAGRCDACDVCRPDLPRPWDEVELTLESVSRSIPATITCLALVRDTEQRNYSRQASERVLYGAEMRYHPALMQSPVYGALRTLGWDGIAGAIDDAIADGLMVEESCVHPDGHSYTTLRLTNVGRQHL
jgi:hypothetical protein